MNKYYLIHHEYCGDGENCGLPLLYVIARRPPHKKDRWYPHQLYCLDGTPFQCVSSVLGPCAHCLTPFTMLPKFFITEEEYRSWHADWTAIHPRYQQFRHYPLEHGQYKGSGTHGRVLTMEKPFTRLRIKQVWPRIDGFWKYVWLHRFDTPRTDHTLTDEENSGEIYSYTTFSDVGGVPCD